MIIEFQNIITFLFFLGLSSLAVSTILIFIPFQASLFLENSIVENLTSFFFGITALASAIFFLQFRQAHFFCFGLIMMFAMMRELDWHKLVTSDSVLKLRFYISPETSLLEKVFGGVIILILGLLTIYFLKKVPKMIQGISLFNPVSLLIFSGIFFLAAGKGIDSSARLFPEVSELILKKENISLIIEETFEMIGAFLFLGVAILLGRDSKIKQS